MKIASRTLIQRNLKIVNICIKEGDRLLEMLLIVILGQNKSNKHVPSCQKHFPGLKMLNFHSPLYLGPLWNDDATLAEHLKVVHGLEGSDLFNLSYSFTVLQLSPHDLDACEQRWVSRLTTLTPFGLNKEAPKGISDSLHNMCRKSLGSFQRMS